MVAEMELTSVSSISATIPTSSSTGWQYLKLCVSVMCSWRLAEKPPETCKAF
jgi:hypothetical protein